MSMNGLENAHSDMRLASIRTAKKFQRTFRFLGTCILMWTAAGSFLRRTWPSKHALVFQKSRLRQRRRTKTTWFFNVDELLLHIVCLRDHHPRFRMQIMIAIVDIRVSI